ncbi:MAG TPA: hypothetical protein EYP20_04425, partial [Aigarchaeota archaeon]|nr:hypothetical protein [Aigarchaeota archaeon]
MTYSDPYFIERLMMEFPFLQQMREYIGSFGIRLEDFAEPGMERLVEKAVSRVEQALVHGVRASYGTGAKPSEEEILSYPLSIALVAMLEDSYATRRFATVEAERYSRLFEKIDPGNVRDVLYFVAREVLRMDVKLSNPPYEFRIHFTDYLRYSVKLNEPRFKLVNRIMDRGYVPLRRPEMLTIIKNALEEYIEERLRSIGRIPTPDFLKPHVERLRNALETRRWRETEQARSKIPLESWPPCMQALRQRLLAGEHVSHFGNFTLAAYLINIGWETEQILQLYAQRGDFDERIA